MSHKNRLAEMAGDITPIMSKVPKFKGMIYGGKGTGKTVLAIGLANRLTDKKIIHIDTSEGWVSLRNHPKLAERVLSLPYKGYEYLETLIYAIEKGVPPFDNVGAMVWDEMSKMVDRDTELVYKARATNQAGVPEWPDYFKALQRIRELSHFLFKTNPDIHLIMTSHEKDKKNKDGSVIFTYPSISPRINEELGGDLHLVGRLTAKTKKGPDGEATYTRSLQVHPTAMYEAKTRVGGLPVSVDPVHFINRTIEWLKVTDPGTSDEIKVTEGDDIDIDITALAELTNDDAPVFTDKD